MKVVPGRRYRLLEESVGIYPAVGGIRKAKGSLVLLVVAAVGRGLHVRIQVVAQ